MQNQVSTGKDLQHQSPTTKDKVKAWAGPLTVARRILEPNNYHRDEATPFNFIFFFEKDMQLSLILKGSKQLLPHPNTIRNLQLEQPRASPSNVLIQCQAQAKTHLELRVFSHWHTSPAWHPPAWTCWTAANRLQSTQLSTCPHLGTCPDDLSSSREQGGKRQ